MIVIYVYMDERNLFFCYYKYLLRLGWWRQWCWINVI